MLEELNIQNILKETKESLKKLYGSRLKDLILYGSFARGEEREGSDIDLMIIINGSINHFEEIKKIVDVTYDIGLKYNILLSVYPISEDRYRSQDTTFLLNVKEEGISI